MAKINFAKQNECYEGMKDNFMRLAKLIVQNEHFVNKAHWSRETINEVILKMKSGKSVDGLKIASITSGQEFLFLNTILNTYRLVPYEECFDVLLTAHIATNHGSEDNIKRFIIGNVVPFFCIPLIIEVCTFCKKRSIQPNSWQVLILTLNRLNEQYHILIYREMTTNYLFLRPLRTKTKEEIAIELLQLFLQFGIPVFLEFSMRTDNTKIATEVMDIIKMMHPPCDKMTCVYDVNTNEESAEIKRITKAILEMLKNHASDNTWALECHTTQYKLNTSCTVLFNYGVNFLCTAIPFEIFMTEGANVNNYRSEGTINAFEWDLHCHYMDTNKTISVKKNTDAMEYMNTFFKIKSTRESLNNSKCSVCARKTFKQFFCRKCKKAIHTGCGAIKETCIDNKKNYEIECALCAYMKNK